MLSRLSEPVRRLGLRLAGVAAVALVLAPLPGAAQHGQLVRGIPVPVAVAMPSPAPAEAVEAGPSLEISAFALALAEGVAGQGQLADFYRGRDWAPIWTGAQDAERRAALITAVSRAVEHGLPAPRYDLDGLIAAFHTVESERDRGLLEARVSRLYLTFARDMTSGVLVPGDVIPEIVRVVERPEQARLLTGIAEEDPTAFLRGLVPQTAEYARLFDARRRLEDAVRSGGWGPTVPAGRLEIGDDGRTVVALRNRLIAMGYMAPTASAVYDGAMQVAVQNFQLAHGLDADGIAGARTIEAINVAPEERLRAVLVAMERERWLNRDRGERHIWVNLADFTTRIVDGDAVRFETRSIIGERRTEMQTPEFSDMMTYMEINPDWTVPRSIVGRNYLAALQANPYAYGQFELVDGSGRTIDRSMVDFTRYSARTLPFELRQPPGPANPLGRVKFMFPNPYAIYLHDTPTRNLFNTVVRAHSNGCVRLQDPYDFAYILLERQTRDPRQLFHSILDTGRQTRLDLETPVPVHLVYRTAFTDTRGTLNFRADVYGRDARLFEALEHLGVALPGVRG